MLDYILSFVSLYFLTYMILTYLEEDWVEPEACELPKVTILIPAFNESETIEVTIRSALSLDYPDFEVIVIDDGSTDDTFQKAKMLPVQVIRQENSGKASALNSGIMHAKGKLIATLDADSFVDPKALLNMVGFFSDKSVMAVTPTMKALEGKGLLEKMQRAEYMLSNLMAKIFSLLDSIIVTPGPFSVYRASVFRELGGFDGSAMTEDNEMALRIQSANFRIRSSKKAFVYTKVPKTMAKLFRQRKRWYSGYLSNMRKYLFLLNPGYGELGSFVIPATTLLLSLSLLKIALDGTAKLGALLAGMPVQSQSLMLQPFELLSIVSFCLGIILFYISVAESRENPSIMMFIHLLLLMMLTPLMYAYALIMRSYETITRRKAGW